MKSYLRFLSRNKLYTAIEVVGLSVALAFVIVLGSYIIDDMTVNESLRNTDEIYLCHDGNSIFAYRDLTDHYNDIPEIEEVCHYNCSAEVKRLCCGISKAIVGDKEVEVSSTSASSDFFQLFTFPLIDGNPEAVLQSKNSIVISEELAMTLFPDGDALGKEINLYEENAMKLFYPHFRDINISLTVTGVFKKFPKTIFYDTDIIINNDRAHDIEQEAFQGMSHLASLAFLKLKKGADSETVASKLTEIFQKYADSYSDDFTKTVTLTAFNDIKKSDIRNLASFFHNTRNGKMFDIYLIMCVFLVLVSLIDYIILTLAFSRFRIKEIATRQILGSDRNRIIGRCFAEAFMLLAISGAFASLIAFAIKQPVGDILGKTIHPLSHIKEYWLLGGIIILMVTVASSIPSIILSSYNPINIIKGQTKYEDKITFGKIFICLTGILSILSLALCFGITRQTRHLVNQPFGYEIDNMIYIRFADKKVHNIDELKSLPYVKNVGLCTGLPFYPTITSIRLANSKEAHELMMIEGDSTFFEIIGVKTEEVFPTAYASENLYLCKDTYEQISKAGDSDIIKLGNRKIPVSGTVGNLKLGLITNDTSGQLSGILIINKPDESYGLNILVKVEENIHKACQHLREFYKSKGISEYNVSVESCETMFKGQIYEERNIQKLLTGFSIICILMSIMTIVGMSSYHTKITERDNAVRNVFGCSKKEMIRRIVMDFTLPVVVSAVLAIPIAYTIIDRWLEGYVIRTDNSPIIYLGAFALIMATVIAAIMIQAIRMIRTNPTEALKKE